MLIDSPDLKLRTTLPSDPDSEDTPPDLAVALATDDKGLIPLKTPRQMGINISGDTLVTNTSHLPDEQRVLVRWAFNYCKDQNYSWREAARALSLSENALYRVFTDKYRNAKDERINLDGLCAILAKAKALAEERASIRKHPFIETFVFRRMFTIAREALISQTIAMVYGDSQIGKTESAQEIKRRINDGTTKYVRIPGASGVQYFLRELATACKVPSNKGIETLRARIAKSVDHTNLLIFDEVHQIFITYSRPNILRTLEIIREICDQAKCGALLIGTRWWREQLETGEYTQFLKQLRRRGCLELQLPDCAPVEDLDQFANAYSLPPAKGEARALILAINKEHGLGRYTKFLAIGARAAQKAKEKYTWDHFQHAYSILIRLKD